MHKISLILICIFLAACSTAIDINAQKPSKGDVLKSLFSMKVFVENGKLKKKAIEQVRTAAQMEHFSEDDFYRLKLAYDELLIAYNREYLNSIKRDLTDYKSYKRILNDPATVAIKYAHNYQQVVDIYNSSFNPVVSEIIDRYSQGDEDLSPLLGIGVNIFKKVVNLLRERKIKKEDIVQLLVNEANNQLFKKLELPNWESMRLASPEGYTHTPIANSFFNNSPLIIKNSISPLPFTNPIIGTAAGSIYFEVYHNTTGKLVPMRFEEGAKAFIEVNDYGSGFSGDQIVGKLPNGNNTIPTTTKITSNFQTVAQYPANTFYRVKTTGDGLVYIFSINSDNTMYGIYPQRGTLDEMDAGTNFLLPPDADQIVGKPTVASTQNSGDNPNYNNSTPLTVTIPDKENFIQIIDPVGKETPLSETLVVIFSRSEIDIYSVLEEMENFGTALSPQERLALIFGSQAASSAQASVQIREGVIEYHLEEEDAAVLPLVFAVKRQ